MGTNAGSDVAAGGGLAAAELVVVTREPFNAETPLAAQTGTITPNDRHYVRNHFAIPAHPGFLEIDGAVERPMVLDVAELARRPQRSMVVTLECAGNGRRFLDPAAPGEPWGLGAVGTAEWAGVPLAELLDEARVTPETVEIGVLGADRGTPAAVGHEIPFERSMPLDVAATALVALTMNGEPLPPDHGAPIRLLVPGRYGMASVKWLTRLTARREPFRGFFQADRYVIDGEPLGPIAPRAVIVEPVDGQRVAPGQGLIRGYAWSGAAPIASVDVSTDGGATWRAADLGPIVSEKAWRSWQISWQPDGRGPTVIVARARDAAGNVQPLGQNRNALGYQNNAAQAVTVEVSAT